MKMKEGGLDVACLGIQLLVDMLIIIFLVKRLTKFPGCVKINPHDPSKYSLRSKSSVSCVDPTRFGNYSVLIHR